MIHVEYHLCFQFGFVRGIITFHPFHLFGVTKCHIMGVWLETGIMYFYGISCITLMKKIGGRDEGKFNIKVERVAEASFNIFIFSEANSAFYRNLAQPYMDYIKSIAYHV